MSKLNKHMHGINKARRNKQILEITKTTTMLQQNGLIKLHHNGIPITFDDLEVELLDRVEHSSYYKCTGFDADGNTYVGVIEKCCGEYEEITDIELT